jgi:hypothetical protein
MSGISAAEVESFERQLDERNAEKLAQQKEAAEQAAADQVIREQAVASLNEVASKLKEFLAGLAANPANDLDYRFTELNIPIRSKGGYSLPESSKYEDLLRKAEGVLGRPENPESVRRIPSDWPLLDIIVGKKSPLGLPEAPHADTRFIICPHPVHGMFSFFTFYSRNFKFVPKGEGPHFTICSTITAARDRIVTIGLGEDCLHDLELVQPPENTGNSTRLAIVGNFLRGAAAKLGFKS